MISSEMTDDHQYRLIIRHKKDNDYPQHSHVMYTDTLKEAVDWVASVYHVFGIVESIHIELHEK